MTYGHTPDDVALDDAIHFYETMNQNTDGQWGAG